jgi:hypothetical protein
LIGNHRIRGSREEMAAAVPALDLFGVHQPQIGFMHEGGRLEGLAGRFTGELMCRQSAKLVVHQRQEFVRRVRLTLFHGR